MLDIIINSVLLILAYLLGSIPSAVWIGRRYFGIDVREHGSKNAGATNTFRVLGKRAGVMVFTMDIAKGFVAVSLGHLSTFFHGSDPLFMFKIALAAAAVIGHIFPVFAGFRGGKGVATLAGAVLGIYPPAVLLCLATFVAVFVITNYVSLSSITAGIMFPLYIVFVFRERSVPLIIFGCVVSVMLLITHRKNIKRLINGTESKTHIIRVRKRNR